VLFVLYTVLFIPFFQWKVQDRYVKARPKALQNFTRPLWTELPLTKTKYYMMLVD